VKVNAQEHVELTGCDCGPKADDSQQVVRYCPELNYTVVLECRANDAVSLEWNISELAMPFSFHVDSVNNSMCDDTSGGITYSLIKMMENNYGHFTYTSQLRVHTSYLRGLDHSNLTVTCQATSEMKKMLLVKISEGNSPQIDKAVFIETGGLSVNWSSDNIDIIKTEVFWENANQNIGNNITVEWYRREVIIDIIERGVSYNVTVVEHNKCQERLFSGKKLVNGQPAPSSSETISAMYGFSPTPRCSETPLLTSTEECLSTPTTTPGQTMSAGGSTGTFSLLITLLVAGGTL
jgi:hypothetical protein